MRRRFALMGCVALVASLAMPSIAADAVAGEQYVGEWVGTWEGSGASGKFDVTLAFSDGKLVGSVAADGEEGGYNAKFSSVSFAGNKMTAKYDYPADDQGEIALTATFEATEANGTWALQAKGQNEAFIAGTWKVTKK